MLTTAKCGDGAKYNVWTTPFRHLKASESISSKLGEIETFFLR